jgi:hypothetical protein
VFGRKPRNSKVREQLELGGGQRAWSVVLNYKFSYSSGKGYAGHPDAGGQIEHGRLTLRVEPENGSPFEATVKAAFGPGQGTPRTDGRIGVIFDPDDHSRLAVYTQWAFQPWEADKARTQEMIAAFLAGQVNSG